MMEQRSVLITGCSSGIGHCVAEGLKLRGYRVFATARKQQDVDALIKQGFESYQLDLADSDSIKAAVARSFDGLDSHQSLWCRKQVTFLLSFW